MLVIHWSDGKPTESFGTMKELLDRVGERYPHFYAGHDGDLDEGGDRTLVWANERDSENDDGRRAVASIRREPALPPNNW